MPIQEIDPVYIATKAGVVPALPAFVNARTTEGELVTTNITWDQVDESQFANDGVVTINGINLASGKMTQAVITVRSDMDEMCIRDRYHGELSYKWSVVSQPEGGNAVIGNADQAKALLKASVPGEYVVRFTAIDADKSASKDVTVTMSGAVDGMDRAVSVVTKVGTAPVLPETVDAVSYTHPDVYKRQPRFCVLQCMGW